MRWQKQEQSHLPSSPVIFLGSTGLEVLVVDRAVLSPEDIARVQLNYKLWLPSGRFEPLVVRDRQVRLVTILARIINSDQQWEVRLILHNANREAYVQNSDEPLGHLLGSWFSFDQL